MQTGSMTYPHDFSYVVVPGAAAETLSAAQPPACANPNCARPGEGARTRAFAGLNLCSSQCVEALLSATLASEHALSIAAALEKGPRVRIGQILVEQGVITEAQLERALRSQRLTGAGRLGTWLRQQTQLPEEEFAAALGIQWGCPVFHVGAFAPARMTGFLPRPLVEALGALPLRVSREPQRLTICFEDRVDGELLRALERMHDIRVEAGLLTSGEFWHGTGELLKAGFPPWCLVEATSLDEMIGAMIETMARNQPLGAQMVCVHGYYWLRIRTGEQDGQVLDVVCTLRPATENAPPGQLVDEMQAGLERSRMQAN